jgi:hypothetical protein
VKCVGKVSRFDQKSEEIILKKRVFAAARNHVLEMCRKNNENKFISHVF